jgi:hypothetical protein
MLLYYSRVFFWMVFILMTLFMLLVVGCLFTFVSREALFRVVHLPEFGFAVRFTVWDYYAFKQYWRRLLPSRAALSCRASAFPARQ